MQSTPEAAPGIKSVTGLDRRLQTERPPEHSRRFWNNYVSALDEKKKGLPL